MTKRKSLKHEVCLVFYNLLTYLKICLLSFSSLVMSVLLQFRHMISFNHRTVHINQRMDESGSVIEL
jgi:hypothetical protein